MRKWPARISNHLSKTPIIINNFQFKSLHVGRTTHKWPPLVSDHNHFLWWLFYNFPLVLTSSKQPPWYSDLISSVFTVCTKQLRVWEEILETTWIYLCWNLGIACNIYYIIYILFKTYMCPRFSSWKILCSSNLIATTSRKRSLTLHSLGDCPQEVRLR